MRQIPLLLLASLAIPAAAQAGTYWVSADGQAAWADCEGQVPLEGASACALDTASTSAVAGDTVYLRGGTYAGQEIRPANSGTSDSARIVFASHDGESVVISDSAYGIYIYKQSFITVDGIDFLSTRRFFRIYAGHHNIIGNCNFDGRSPESGDWAGAIIADDFADDTAASEDSTHNRVHHCSFFRWVYGAYDENRGALLNLGSDQSAGDDSSFNLVEDNIFAYGGHHTLGVYSQFNVIRNNYIHNETNPANWDFAGYRGAITEGPSAGRCLYQGNRFGFSDGSGMALRSPHNIFRFNQFYRNGSGAIQVVSNNAGVDHADHNHIYGNSMFHNGHLATYSGFQGGMYFTSWSGVSPVGNVVKNNIFYDSRNGSISYDGTVDPQVIENNWDQNDVDPGFVDLSGEDPDDPLLPDLQLRPDSAAKDQGTWLTTITSPDGSADSFAVADADYFMDGWGVIDGDLIQLAGQSQTARVIGVDYQADTLSLDRALTFTSGQGVSLAYSGAAPELGAFEIWEGEGPDGGVGGDGAVVVDGAGAVDGSGGVDGGAGVDVGAGVDAAAGADRAGPQDAEPGSGAEGCSCRGLRAPGWALLQLGVVAVMARRRSRSLHPKCDSWCLVLSGL